LIPPGVLLNQPSQLGHNKVEEGVYLIFVIAALADQRLTERDVANVYGPQTTSNHLTPDVPPGLSASEPEQPAWSRIHHYSHTDEHTRSPAIMHAYHTHEALHEAARHHQLIETFRVEAAARTAGP
jgi:hypothetical protein